MVKVDLDIRQITLLYLLCERIAGDPDTTIRGEADDLCADLWEYLPNYVRCNLHDLDASCIITNEEDSITFTENSVEYLDRVTNTRNSRYAAAQLNEEIFTLESKIKELNRQLAQKQIELQGLSS